MPLPAAPPAIPAELSLDAAVSTFLSALRTQTTLLVAVSGGSDSIGLLSSLHEHLRAKGHSHRLVAATVDHQLRPRSRDEAIWVGNFCAQHGIPHQILSWTAEKPKTGLPAAARQARYRLLAEGAHAMGASAIVTGHTLDDQLETISMRKARSSDVDAPGLAGMASATLYERQHWILRPLLGVRRRSIRDVLIAKKLHWIDDPSNEDRSYERVRVRQAPMPISADAVDAAAKARLEKSEAAARWIASNVSRVAETVMRIDLNQIDPSQQSGGWPHDSAEAYALATLAAVVGGKPYRPAREAMISLLEALATNKDLRRTLSGALILRRKAELFLVRERRGLLPLPLPAHQRCIWDGRYAFENPSSEDLQIIPGKDVNIPTGLPGAIAAAMRENLPRIQRLHDEGDVSAGNILQRHYLALIDYLLPGFDLPLALALDHLFSREPTPFCPI